MTLIDPTRSPAGVPAPELLHDGELRVPNNSHYPDGRAQRYPLEVWRVCNGMVYAIVSHVPGANSSPMNAAEKIAAAIREQWSVEAIITHWPDGHMGRRFVHSSENGGLWELDYDELRGLGLVFPEPHIVS